MIQILKRYLAKSIFTATAVTALVIIAVMFIVTFLTELKDTGQGDYGFAQAFLRVAAFAQRCLSIFSDARVVGQHDWIKHFIFASRARGDARLRFFH